MKRSSAIAGGVVVVAFVGAIAWVASTGAGSGSGTGSASETGAGAGSGSGSGSETETETGSAGEPSSPAETAGSAPAVLRTGAQVGPAPSGVAPDLVAAAVRSAEGLADEEITRRIAALEAEPRDEAWASQQEQEIRAWADTTVTTMEGRVTGIECRTSSCRIEVVWPDYDTASREVRDFLGGQYGSACERETRAPMPQDPRLPYAGLVMMTCVRE